jgi:hypothetical protein
VLSARVAGADHRFSARERQLAAEAGATAADDASFRLRNIAPARAASLVPHHLPARR